ncbi:MAG: hypothetical protein IPL78_11605 [Chloroflexi bacterium]|nr:hypothetical protein [Chloroflexota bacterium]
MSTSLESLTLEAFTPHLGTDFTIALSNGETLTLQLADIKPLGHGRERGREPFALTFHHPQLPRNAHLPQHIYHLKHTILDPVEIFLVPLGPQQGLMRYEAIFT